MDHDETKTPNATNKQYTYLFILKGNQGWQHGALPHSFNEKWNQSTLRLFSFPDPLFHCL